MTSLPKVCLEGLTAQRESLPMDPKVRWLGCVGKGSGSPLSFTSGGLTFIQNLLFIFPLSLEEGPLFTSFYPFLFENNSSSFQTHQLSQGQSLSEATPRRLRSLRRDERRGWRRGRGAVLGLRLVVAVVRPRADGLADLVDVWY